MEASFQVGKRTGVLLARIGGLCCAFAVQV
jgi:hypothetical protein